jgi:N-acetylglucosaminyl-diphospho-decaprenol L-rhamnosyltransferase
MLPTGTGDAMTVRDSPLTVVIATRNRAAELEATIERLQSLSGCIPIVVVDNASHDGTASRVRRGHPEVQVLELRENLGAAARTVGAFQTTSPYVAFSVLVGTDERLDPVCAAMASSPLAAAPDLPGPPVLGFVACGAVVRRSAFLQAGGFHRRFGVGGEEELLAVDLAAAGWGLAYVEEVVAHHHPSRSRDPEGRRRVQVRNGLWSIWLRRPLGVAAGRTLSMLMEAAGDAGGRTGVVEAVRGLPWVLRARRPVPREVEADLRRLGS